MSRYDPATPRLAFGIAAIAATAATLGLLVLLPSRMEADRHVDLALAATTTCPQPRCEDQVLIRLPAAAIEALRDEPN